MKHSPILAACLLSSGAALAQSSVTIYGSLDQSVVRISNLGGDDTFRVDPGTTQPDRIGFRGIEDLGGGLKANFWLEHGFFTDTGGAANPTAFFNRNATVGLSGGFGAVSLGHQPDLMFDWVGKSSNGFLLQNFYAFHPGNFDVLANTFQYDNAVRYNTPTWGGLTLGAIYGFGENPAGSKINRNTSFGGNYQNGPLRVAAAYSEQNNRTLRGFAPFAAASGLPASGVMDKVENAGIGASYRFGQIGVNSVYTQTKMEAGSVSATLRNLDLGASWNTEGGYTFNAGYTRSDLEDVYWNTFNLMALYNFSKRTQIYVQGTLQKASDGQVAVINGAGASSDRDMNVIGVGLHHSF